MKVIISDLFLDLILELLKKHLRNVFLEDFYLKMSSNIHRLFTKHATEINENLNVII